jgi:hypothetical protein
MDDELEVLTTQIGLLLSQVRMSRRALEDIERATAQYANFAFSSVIGAGKAFGDPPMVDGALKVHIVNIADLAPGSGFGALIEGLLGGAGRFVGNLFGGVIGGFISSEDLIKALPTIREIAERIQNILKMLGLSGGSEPPDQRGGPSGGGGTLPAKLDAITRAVNGLTGLFLAAGGETEKAAGVSDLPSTPQGERWKTLLDSASGTLTAMGNVVNGLIVALPIAIGSIAWLISRLADIRVAIAETLQFLLRNALLLRGALTVTLFDTLALVARVGARVIQVLGDTLSQMLAAVFTTIRDALTAVLQLGAVLGDAVKTTIDSLLNWLVPTLDQVLRNVGNLRAFRVLTHVIRILPAILPPIYELKTDKPLEGTQVKALEEAGKIPFLDVTPGPAGAPATTPIPAAPDIRGMLTDPALTGKLTDALGKVETVTTTGLDLVKDTGTKGLTGLAGALDKAAIEESKLSNAKLDQRLSDVATRSKTLADQLVVPEEITPDTGLAAIAKAYESWLSDKDGLDSLLGNITKHFSSPEGRTGIPQKIVEGGLDRPRATVQIDEVVIEVEVPIDLDLQPSEGPGDFPLPPEGDDVERFARLLWDYERRGGDLLVPGVGV